MRYACDRRYIWTASLGITPPGFAHRRLCMAEAYRVARFKMRSSLIVNSREDNTDQMVRSQTESAEIRAAKLISVKTT